MKGDSKFIGKVYEGRWEVVKYDGHHFNYTLKNIFNNREMVVCVNTLRRIDAGETTVSAIIKKRGKLEGLNIYSW